jgi:hypothetical protein
MKSLYEVINIDLAQEYTKERKRVAATSLELDDDLAEQVFAAIDEMDIPDADERHHWITKIAHSAAADLLTLGKVQPENMLAMAALQLDDFNECVQIATSTARNLNDATVSAEKQIATDTIPDSMT